MEIRPTDTTPLPESHAADADWRGTASAETSIISSSSDLYELAGLAGERSRWSIVGIEMDAYSHGKDPRWTIRVYAADCHELGVTNFADWEEVAARHGGIPVVDVLLHEVSLDDVIRCMKTVGVQLRSGGLNHPLLRAAHADHPEQG